jgi:Na+/citrate or Na+/malate symporter
MLQDEVGASAVTRKWWQLMDTRIGIVPLPLFAVLLALTAGFVAAGKVPSDILMNIAVLAIGGFACAELGKRIPYINQIGASAIFATFVPSYLVFAHLLPVPVIASITTFTKSSNFLYLFISAVIVGSILGMDRRVLITGFIKIFVPLALGSIVACLVGLGVGALVGLDVKHTFFFIVVPIMAGGVGEGALPLAAGYEHFRPGVGGGLAEILPAVMLGSLSAIVFSGILNRLGKAFPSLTGEGKLSIGEKDEVIPENDHLTKPQPVVVLGAATVLIATMYLCGQLAQTLWHWPGPVVMLALTVLLKFGQLVSPSLERGAFAVYQFFRVGVTYPLLFAIGVAMTPWEDLLAALHPANIVTIVATVAALMGTGFATARLLNLYPIEVAIVNACHCGQGGTGSIAILTAANRMRLMPFAQIATRTGGAIIVALALIAFARFA